MKIKINLVGGIVLFIFSVTFYLLIPYQIVDEMMQNEMVNSQFLPRVIAILLGLLSVVLIIQSTVLNVEKVIEVEVKDEVRTLIFFGITILYLVVLNFVGFIISSVLMTTTTLLYFKSRNWRHYVACYVTVAICYVLFAMILKVNFPVGFGG